MVPKMKKVLHLLSTDRFSGAENVVCTIIDNMKQDFDFAYCSRKGTIEISLKKRKIKYYGLENFNKKSLKKIINDYKPDIIHAHDYRASLLASITFNGKIISHLHINADFAKKWNFDYIFTIFF